MANKKDFARDCKFIAGATSSENTPDFHLPELAFWGKSNVGKSSLVNAVTGRRLLAKVSNTPGRTKQLNFFEIDQRMILVDLPGYGYAKASKVQINSWNRLILSYLQNRHNLVRVYLLIDSRHPLKDNDIEAMKILDEVAISYKIVLTKCDKRESDLKLWQGIFTDLQSKHAALHQEFIATSTKSGCGIDQLRADIKSL